jgi:hypothetical protein
MGNPKRIAGLVAALVITSVVAGCSSASISNPTASAAPPTSSASPATEIDFGSTPAVGPSCDTILSIDTVRTVVPSAAATPLVGLARVDGSWFAAMTSGGLTCAATNGVSQLDDVQFGARDTPVYQGVVVTVLPDAADEFQRYSGQASEAGAVAGSCAATDSARLSCTGDLLAGTAWLSVSATRVQDDVDASPEVMDPKFTALVRSVASAVRATALATADAPTTTRPVAPTACSATRVNAVASTRLIDAWANTDYYQDASLTSLARADEDRCQFVVDTSGDWPHASTGAVYTSLPNGGWVVRARLAAGAIARDGRIDLPDLGAHDAAWRTCDTTACSVDIVHDGAWTHYLLTAAVAPSTSDAIEQWVRSSWRA